MGRRGRLCVSMRLLEGCCRLYDRESGHRGCGSEGESEARWVGVFVPTWMSVEPLKNTTVVSAVDFLFGCTTRNEERFEEG